MKIINIPLNIPNVLSLYRLFSFPFVMIFIFLGHETLFAFFIWFNLTTDILDGWIARRFNQMTEIGEKIDGIADSGTYILALTGIFVFKWTDFQPHAISFFIFIGLFIISRLLSLLKFRVYFGYHSVLIKIAGYIHGAFFIVLFFLNFYIWFYYIVMISGYIVFTESILITLILKEPRSHVKGFFWLLKSRKEVNQS
ncbi:MAG: CDP-alcohol phosphatidyltransferase family protein [Bacteroidia bacterium]|nr:CDP-alcohol phosphatidyltransferase family protein [Bacteroidia bacterium]